MAKKPYPEIQQKEFAARRAQRDNPQPRRKKRYEPRTPRKKDSYTITAETRSKPHRELARKTAQGRTEVNSVKAGFRSTYGRGKYLVKTYNSTKEKYVK